jgi:hypothetical protein
MWWGGISMINAMPHISVHMYLLFFRMGKKNMTTLHTASQNQAMLSLFNRHAVKMESPDP